MILSQKEKNIMKIIVGGVIEKDGKVLLVQEKQERCYGKWNLPAGHLDFNESLIDGAKREIKEETGCDVELIQVANIANRILENDIFLQITFRAKLINETIKIDPEEILDVKWFDINDVLNNMDEQLRDLKFIKQPIKNILENKVGDINIVNIF